MLVGACSTVAPCRADAGGPLRSQCHAAFSRWPYSRSTTRNFEPPPSLPIFNRGVRILAEVVQQSGPVPHGRICRHAWIVGSVVEFLDQGSELLSAEGGCKLAFESAVLLLSDCCLRGPLAGQPAIVTALGFALRRCPVPPPRGGAAKCRRSWATGGAPARLTAGRGATSARPSGRALQRPSQDLEAESKLKGLCLSHAGLVASASALSVQDSPRTSRRWRKQTPRVAPIWMLSLKPA